MALPLGGDGGGLCLYCYAIGVEHKPFGRLAVKTVANDGIVKAKAVGTMDTKLMCAACYRVQLYQGVAVAVLKDTVMCLCRLAVLGVNQLAGAVVEVGSQGQANVALLSDRHLLFKCIILLYMSKIYFYCLA